MKPADSSTSGWWAAEAVRCYYAFLTDDFSTGTFGHPWEQTLCVIGDAMIDTLGRSLLTWLPLTRMNGAPAGR